jgi:hypothetical protein
MITRIHRVHGDALLVPNYSRVARWVVAALFAIALGCSSGVTLAGLYFLHAFAEPSPTAADVAATTDTLEKLRAENESLRVTVADYVKRLNNGARSKPMGIGGP